MRVLHTKITRRVMEPLAGLLEGRGLAVEFAALGDGTGDALLAGAVLTEDEFLTAEKAGVRWAQILSIGLERVLTPALVDSHVMLTSVSGLGAVEMAEFVFARILEQAKKLRELAEMQRDHTWKTVWLGALKGATLTIVGLGPIGTAAAALGRAHRMHLIGVRRRPESGPGPCDEVVGPGALLDVVGRTDYLVLAPPLTDDTRGMIGARELAAMKAGAFLVNVGRGDLIDQPALLDALGEGRIAAALDVFETEPLPEDSLVWDTAALAVSPHCSSLTPALFTEMAEIVADNIERFARGEPLRHVVDKRAGYPLSG